MVKTLYGLTLIALGVALHQYQQTNKSSPLGQWTKKLELTLDRHFPSQEVEKLKTSASAKTSQTWEQLKWFSSHGSSRH